MNFTFDQLSQLLPEYQPKANFSKIEILQKSIVYIEDLRAKLKDVLAKKNASILSKARGVVMFLLNLSAA